MAHRPSASKADDAPTERDQVEANVMVWTETASGKEFRLSFEHAKLLYMVSFYGNASKNPKQEETWLRKMQLDVLIYEAIVAGKLDFDYAPVSRIYAYMSNGKSEFKRRYLNISQEGSSAIQDLVGQGFINTIKLLTEDQLPTSAFQVSYRGSDLLKSLPPLLRLDVDQFVMGARSNKRKPHPTNDLKHVIADEIGFIIATMNGYEERSEVTETEGVSYVTSPFLPWVLRVGESAFTDNASRSWEAGQGLIQVKDQLSEAIVLSQVYVMIVEWVPFGANQFCHLLARMGVGTGFVGGAFTSDIDRPPYNQLVITPAEHTAVRYLESRTAECVNFEAEIKFPEADGIKQVEHLGIQIAKGGWVHVGVRIEAIGTRLADDISLDLLARLLVDVSIDATRVLDDLLAERQRRLLDLVHRGGADARPKFHLLWAEKMDPTLRAAMFMDRGALENELKQVIGEVLRGVDYGEKGDVVIIGASGMLVVGRRVRVLDRALVAYAAAAALLAFVRAFHARTCIFMGELDALEVTCQRSEENRLMAEAVRSRRARLCGEASALEEALAQLRAGAAALKLPPPPGDAAGRGVWKALALPELVQTLEDQLSDLEKLVSTCLLALRNLQGLIRGFQATGQGDVTREVLHDTERMCATAVARQRRAAAVEVMEWAVVAAFALFILDAFLSGRASPFAPSAEERAAAAGAGSAIQTTAAAGATPAPSSGLSIPTGLGALTGGLSAGGLGNSSYFPLQWTNAVDQFVGITFLLHILFIAGFVSFAGRAKRALLQGATRVCHFELERPVSLERLEVFAARASEVRGGGLIGDLIDMLGLRARPPVRRATRDGVLILRYRGPSHAQWRGPPPDIEIAVDVVRAVLLSVRCHQDLALSPPAWAHAALFRRRMLDRSAAAAAGRSMLDATLDDLAAAGVFDVPLAALDGLRADAIAGNDDDEDGASAAGEDAGLLSARNDEAEAQDDDAVLDGLRSFPTKCIAVHWPRMHLPLDIDSV